jgi:prepilin-type N-terminal cleavage/methylation domain-containing protein
MKKGFTLIELMVVFLILSVASVWVIPRIAQPLGGIELKTSARHVLSALRLARSRAVTQKVNIIAHFDLQQKKFILAQSGGGMDTSGMSAHIRKTAFQKTDNVKILDEYEFPEEVEIQHSKTVQPADTEDVFQILFYPSGRSSGGKVLFSGNSVKKYLVHVDFVTGITRLSTTN